MAPSHDSQHCCCNFHIYCSPFVLILPVHTTKEQRSFPPKFGLSKTLQSDYFIYSSPTVLSPHLALYLHLFSYLHFASYLHCTLSPHFHTRRLTLTPKLHHQSPIGLTLQIQPHHLPFAITAMPLAHHHWAYIYA